MRGDTLNKSILLLLILSIVISKSYYDVLGVPKSATTQQIKSSFKKLARKHHPDRSNHPKFFQPLELEYPLANSR